MKKFLLCLVCCLTSPILLAEQVTLKVQFDSQPNGIFYKHSLHLNKTIQFDPQRHAQAIIDTQSELIEDAPVTTTMIVKGRLTSANEIALQFNLVNYGFNRSAALIAQPQFILKNGQAAELQDGLYKIKVTATWNKTA